MANIHIDPELGPDAAMGVSDEELKYLCQIVLWELAVRTDEREFEDCLQETIQSRRENGAKLDETRHHRDLMLFAAEVTADIGRLPEVIDPADEPSTGLYL
jgi:hypothetical protein